MRRRKLRWVAGLAVLLAVGALVLWPRAERITAAIFHRIQAGMSLAEVEAILGPPGDHSTVPEDYGSLTKFTKYTQDSDTVVEESWGSGRTAEEWEFDRARVWVLFDASGKVAGAQITPVRRIECDPIDSLLWRAKRQWRRWFSEKPEAP
jgi:hypothetical protein